MFLVSFCEKNLAYKKVINSYFLLCFFNTINRNLLVDLEGIVLPLNNVN